MDLQLLLDPFQAWTLPLADWATDGMRWLTSNYRDVFRAVKAPVKVVLDLIEDGLKGAPQSLVVLVMALIAWQFGGRKVAAVTLFSMAAIGLIGAWNAAMTSMATNPTTRAVRQRRRT